jgi:hypothetical protein
MIRNQRSLVWVSAAVILLLALALLLDAGSGSSSSVLFGASGGNGVSQIDGPGIGLEQEDADGISRSAVDLSGQVESREGDPRGVLIMTTTVDGKGIPGADLFSVEGTVERRIGRTNVSGELEVPAPLGPCLLVAQAAGMGQAERRVDSAGSGGRIQIVLRPEARLRGRVQERGSTGDPIPGARVWAMPADEVNDFTFIHPMRARRSAAGSATTLQATTDSQGYFEIGGLDPTKKYDVSSIKYGWRTIDAKTGWEHTADVVELNMARCWGCLVRLPIQASSGTRLTRVGWQHWEPVSGYFDRASDFGVMIDEDLLLAWGEDRHLDPRTWLTILYFSRDGEEDLGSLILDVNVPGYEPKTETVVLDFIGSSIPVIELDLSRTADELGSLDVSFSGLPDRLARADADMIAGSLHFHPLFEGQDQYFDLTFPDLRAGAKITGVPVGLCRVHFVPHPGHGNAPNTSGYFEGEGGEGLVVEVTSTGAMVEIDGSHLSLVAIQMLDSKGDPYDGLLNFEIYREVEHGEGVDWTMGRGTVISSWRFAGEEAMVLAYPGNYRLYPIPRVLGLLPIVDANERGHPVRTIELELEAGQAAPVVLQAIEPAIIVRTPAADSKGL